MSVGVNVVLKLLDLAARALSRGLRHRDHRGAPPPQGRRAQRHRAGRWARCVAARARPRPEGLRGLRPRRRHRRARPVDDRLCHRPRRRHRRRPHRAVRRHRRAHRDHATRASSRATYAAGQPARGALPGRPAAGPVRHGRRARPEPRAARRCPRMQRLGGQLLGAGRLRSGRAVRGAAAAADVGQRLGADLLEGLAAAPRAQPTSHARCRPSGPPARWTTAAPRLAALDREQVLLPLLDAATAQPAAGTLETRGPPRLAAHAPPARRAAPRRWRTCSSARCCWRRSAAPRPSSACSARSGASTTRWSASRRPAASPSRRSPGPVGEALIMTAAGLAVAIPAVLAYNVFGKWVAACEAELEGFAHDLREMVLDGQRRARGTEPMAFGRLERSAGAAADERHQHDAADRRDAGAAGDLHDHRAADDAAA